MKYAAKKIVWMLLTMVIVSFLAFLAFRIIPGDPTAKLLGEQATPERVEALRQELGLDRPFLERYVSWLGDFVRGDMGSSYNYSMPVSQMLQGKIPVTGLLTLLSFLLIVVLSIPLGLFTARHSGGALDKAPDGGESGTDGGAGLLYRHPADVPVRPAAAVVRAGELRLTGGELLAERRLSGLPPPPPLPSPVSP